MGVDKINGAGRGAAITKINFAYALDGPGNKAQSSRKSSSEVERKRAQQEKLSKSAIQDYETQKAKTAAQETTINQGCFKEAVAFSEASKNYEIYLSQMQENYFRDAKQAAIDNINKTRKGNERKNYRAMIESLPPADFHVQDHLSAEEAKTLAGYKATLAAARQNLSNKLSLLLGPQAKKQSGQVEIFRYINELIYVPPPVETAAQIASKP